MDLENKKGAGTRYIKSEVPCPEGAKGFPSRDPELDAYPGFVNPPPGYGEVAFYWWLGDRLTKERLEWQLNQLQDKGVMGLQVNYAHSDQGGLIYGYTYPSDPPLFSEEWWELFRWFLKEAKKRDMSVSLSDYTLSSPGQGWYTDEIIRENPDLHGAVLHCEIRETEGGPEVCTETPQNTIAVVAYKLRDGIVEPGTAVDLNPLVNRNTLKWNPPQGKWRIFLIHSVENLDSLDPMNPLAGKKVIETFFSRFEDRNPGEGGKGLDFFFSDELCFGVEGNLWNGSFPEEFRKRKGYDLIPGLPALFADIGPVTPKIRLDYRDVMVALEEEGYFRPIFDWHQERGMIYGCDHGGRGRNVAEFGDYFRTQRWNQGPGNDQPALHSDVIKNKVSSSIAHLYERPRTWLEGFHSSGWGTSSGQVADATFRNFVSGHNLLTLHGLYYSTHGGWWEWAPPCNHFRMPYWRHMGEFLRCSERLSYLLSQGVHRCDVAILYPVAPVEAGMDGDMAVKAAFEAGYYLFDRGIDYDFMDFQSLERAQVRGGALHVAGEVFRVLILPAMKAIRFAALEKTLEFFRAGGIVIALGALPEASDRAGRRDPVLDGIVEEIFGRKRREPGNAEPTKAESMTAEPEKEDSLNLKGDTARGKGYFLYAVTEAEKVINDAFPRDFACLSSLPEEAKSWVMHRKVGRRDIYMVYGVPRDTECFFRARGNAELWDPWTGKARRLPVLARTGEGTRMRMPLEANEAQLIVFQPGEAALLREGDVKRESRPVMERLCLDGEWEFTLEPTLDNRWGDFRLPAFDGTIGAEARKFRYRQEPETAREKPVCKEPAREGSEYEESVYAEPACKGPDWENPAFGEPVCGESARGWEAPELEDSAWTEVTCSYGPYFYRLGPVGADTDYEALEAELSRLTGIDERKPVKVSGRELHWQTCDFSMRLGVENAPGHQGYHGLKEIVNDDFLLLGRSELCFTGSRCSQEGDGGRYYLWTTVRSAAGGEAVVRAGSIKPSGIRVNGTPYRGGVESVSLKAGVNTLLLCYEGYGRTHFLLEDPDAPKDWRQTRPLAMSWYNRPGVLGFDPYPQRKNPVGWYRFTAAPGLRSMTVTAFGTLRCWVGGTEAPAEAEKTNGDGSVQYKVVLPGIAERCEVVAIRLDHIPGCYGGAALPEPIALDCVTGRMETGDWSEIDGLRSYSGGARYRRSFLLEPEAVGGKCVLNLGEVVSSAEVRINGRFAGIRVAPPWKFDITDLVRPGENEVEVFVYNTLANHYLTIPTFYRGSLKSGLIGPVTVETERKTSR